MNVVTIALMAGSALFGGVVFSFAYFLHTRRKIKLTLDDSDKVVAPNIFETQYKTLTDNLLAAVVIRDHQGKISFASPYTEVLTGYAVSEIYSSIGEFFDSIVHNDDIELYGRALKVIETGEPFQVRYRFFHRSGLEMWAETRSMPIMDHEGKVISSLSITFDVTATIRYQHQVEEKNRDIQDFTYMLSHDLKAPLFTIRGMVGVLEEDFAASLTPEVREILEHISRASKRLEQLVGSVIEYSKVATQGITTQPIPLSEVMDEVIGDVAQLAKEKGASITVAQDLPSVEGEKLKMYQIFTNLVGNALKYSAKERPLELSIKSVPSKNVRTVTIQVSDNGEGIPAEKLPTIFRPFQRAHGPEVEGSGIGLAIVKKLIEKLSGTITVQSTPGVGTTFELTFRRAEPK